jgi:hypothetical protein
VTLESRRLNWRRWLVCFAAAATMSLAGGAPVRCAVYSGPRADITAITTVQWQLAQYSPQQRAQLEAARRTAQAAAAAQRAKRVDDYVSKGLTHDQAVKKIEEEDARRRAGQPLGGSPP